MRRTPLRLGLLATAGIALLNCGRSEFLLHADPPSRLDAQAGRHSAVVRWEAVPGAARYRVYAAPSASLSPSNFAALGGVRVDATATSAQVVALSSTADWFFLVQSVRDDQGGEPSSLLSVRPLGTGTAATMPVMAASTRVDGDQSNAHFGYVVDGAGDVNGDGYADVIVGSPNRQVSGQNNAGRTEIFFGGPLGLATTAAWTVESSVPNGVWGLQARGLGDINHDGYGDVIVCTPNIGGGEAQIFTGRPGGPLTSYTLSIPAPVGNAGFGFGCSGIGDVNHDGYDDLAVGAYGEDGNKGAAYLYLGGPSGLLSGGFVRRLTPTTNGFFGWSVGRAGDVDGDGFDDLLVTGVDTVTGNAPNDRGRAWVFHGNATGLSTSGLWTVAGDTPGGFFGNRSGYAGDLNGDGLADVAIGAILHVGTAGNPQAGMTSVFFGTAGGLTLAPARTITGSGSEQSGLAVSTVGDLDGDGTSDLVIGAHLADDGAIGNDCGKISFYPGGVAAAPRSIIFGKNAGDMFGFSAAGAGDVNGDGSPDLAVGAYNANGSKGALWVLYGPPRESPRADAGPALVSPPGSPISPIAATFSDLPVGTSWTCHWDWGDGSSDTIACTPATAAAVSHTYTLPGTFDVRLTVTNVFGLAGQSLTKARIGAAAAAP